MAYYAYDSTANFLFLGPTVLLCISKERRCDKELHVRGVGNFAFEPVIRKLRRLFFEGQLNVRTLVVIIL